MRMGLGSRFVVGASGVSASQSDLRSSDDQHQTDDRPDHERLAEQKHPVEEGKGGGQVVRERRSLSPDMIYEPVVEHVAQRRAAQTERYHRQYRSYTG